MTTEVQSRRWGSHRGLLGALWLTLVILAVKGCIGLATQSLGLFAASMHTLVVSFSLILSWLTLAFPDTPSRHTWGHGKTDTLLTLLVTGLISFAGLTLLNLAVQQLSTPLMGRSIAQLEPLNLPSIQLLMGMIAISLCLGILGRSHPRILENPVLSFSLGLSLQDAGIMVIAVIGLIGSQWIGTLDPVLAIAVIGITIAQGWRVLNRQLPSLVKQVAIAPEALTNTIRRVEGIVHCYGIQSHGLVGRRIYVEASLILHPDYLELSNDIIRRVQQAINQQYGSANVVIHIERDRPTPPKGN